MPTDTDESRLDTERLLTLAQVAPLFTKHDGKKIDVPQITRFITRGYKDVKLAARHTAAGWVTSAAAVQRFLAAVDREP